MKKLTKYLVQECGYKITPGKPYLNKVYPFKWDTASSDKLHKSLLQEELWHTGDASHLADNELYKLWKEVPDGHKWHHYFPIYEKIFSPLRKRAIKILEIGVYKGASLELWRRYFDVQSVIVGIDIDETCTRFDDPSRNIHIRIGGQQDPDFVNSVAEEFGPFDLIIDDGSHVTSHMIDSFNILFEHHLSGKGIYFAEDTHSNYWLSHRDDDRSFLDFAKNLTDLINYHYTVLDSEMYYRHGWHRPGVESIADTPLAVPKITRLIEEIRFFDSIVVLYKNDELTRPVSEHL